MSGIWWVLFYLLTEIYCKTLINLSFLCFEEFLNEEKHEVTTCVAQLLFGSDRFLVDVINRDVWALHYPTHYSSCVFNCKLLPIFGISCMLKRIEVETHRSFLVKCCDGTNPVTSIANRKYDKCFSMLFINVLVLFNPFFVCLCCWFHLDDQWVYENAIGVLWADVSSNIIIHLLIICPQLFAITLINQWRRLIYSANWYINRRIASTKPINITTSR